MAPNIVATIVPLGIETLGSFRSPESPSPAEIHVKAGNMMVNT